LHFWYEKRIVVVLFHLWHEEICSEWHVWVSVHALALHWALCWPVLLFLLI
jgi:hypothetical protein